MPLKTFNKMYFSKLSQKNKTARLLFRRSYQQKKHKLEVTNFYKIEKLTSHEGKEIFSQNLIDSFQNNARNIS